MWWFVKLGRLPDWDSGMARPPSSPFLAFQEVIKVVQPVLLGKIIMYFENYDKDDMKALYETLGYAAALSLCAIGLALLHHLYFYHVQRAGMKIRVAMCHMIYKKVSREFCQRRVIAVCGSCRISDGSCFFTGSVSQQFSHGKDHHRPDCQPPLQ